MKKTTMAGLVGLLFTSSAFATSVDAVSDDVIVTASRIPQTKETTTADVSVINKEEIERGGQSTLVELLQSQPGVEIDNSGGPGKISGIFLRGTKSSHVVILIDGMRMNSATAGTTTLENIPLAQIDHIEILRGPASSLYGQDAIGGVIQIFTNKGQGKPLFNASVGYGTYNTKTAEAGVSGKIDDTSYALNVSSYDTKGFSAYKTNNPKFSDKDGYRNLSASGSISYNILEGHTIGAQFFRSEGHTDFDNRFNTTNFGDNANLTQQSYALTSNNQITDYWLSKLRLGQSSDESENFSELGRDLYKTEQNQYSWQNDFSLPLGTLTFLYDKLEERVKSTTIYNNTKRDNDGYALSYFLDYGAQSVQASYRNDQNSQFGSNNTGSLGYGFRFTPNWRITGNYGTAFKAPTFNDLYFPDSFGFQTSNPNLKPEKSRNLEASLRFEDATSSASATVYRNKIHDLIVLDSTTFIPYNTHQALIEGLTLAATQRLDDWQFKGNIDIQSPNDEGTDTLLVRRANRHAAGNISRDWGNWRFATEVIGSSLRYNDAANTQRLAGYALLNLTTSYKVNQEWNVQARVNNLLDKDYALGYDGNPNTTGFIYNTPGANLFVSVRYQPK